MLPIEYIVLGTPKSVQAKASSKVAWKSKVRDAATAALPSIPTVATDAVRVTILYFYESTDLDIDNILKPVLDAMNGLIYVDDGQVVEIFAAKRNLSSINTTSDLHPILATQLASSSGGPEDFVFIRVESADEGVIP